MELSLELPVKDDLEEEDGGKENGVAKEFDVSELERFVLINVERSCGSLAGVDAGMSSVLKWKEVRMEWWYLMIPVG